MESKYSILFFQNVGKLFYAISASDGSINENEIKILKKLMITLWENELYSEHVVITFDKLVKEQATSEDCFKDFVVYKNENKSLFTPELNQLIAEAAGAIASSFSKKNKSELIILAKLALELKK